jgi:hypothetical protein
MSAYYVSVRTDRNGEHEVHSEECGFLPIEGERLLLGEFEAARDAITEAARLAGVSVACVHCCRPRPTYDEWMAALRRGEPVEVVA